MGKNLNKVLAITALMMIVAVIGAVSYNFFNKNTRNYLQDTNFTVGKVYFDEVGIYGDGLIPVKLYNQWGYCDKTGKIMIVPQYTEAERFSTQTQLAPVKLVKDRMYGYINKDGVFQIEPQFQKASVFSDGLAVCRSQKNEKEGYIDSKGDVKISSQFLNAGELTEGLAAVKRTENGKFEYIDKTGKTIIPAGYEAASEFSEGAAAVKVGGKWGYIDPHGKYILKPQYVEARTFHNGLAGVKNSNEWSYIDQKGTVVLAGPYDNAGDFGGSIAPVCKNGIWTYVDKTGVQVVDQQFTDAHSFTSGVAAAKLSGKWVLVIDNNFQENKRVEGTKAEEQPKAIETVTNKNILGLVKEISLNAGESMPLSGTIKTVTTMEKLLLNVLGEDGKPKGIYLTIEPKTNTYQLREVTIDSKIEPFNVTGSYRLQIWAKVTGISQESKIGEVIVKIKAKDAKEKLALDVVGIDSSDYPLVRINATVSENGNKPVLGLGLNNFSVSERQDGTVKQTEQQQNIVNVSKANTSNGLKIALVLDSSLSMYNKDKSEKNSNMAAAKVAATGFIYSSLLAGKDGMAIASFGKTFSVHQGFTLDKKKLVTAVQGIKGQPDTAIFDAVSKSVELLSKQQGNKCLIVFTDGADTSSKLTAMDAVNRAVKAGVTIYSIALGQAGKTNELKSLSDKTGGSFYYLKNPKALNEIYQSITEKQKNMYQIKFQSTTTAMTKTNIGSGRRIRLSVNLQGDYVELEKSYLIK